MIENRNDTPEAAEPLISRSARDEQRRRNALARRKLEALREHKRLRLQLADVWDEHSKPGSAGSNAISNGSAGAANPGR